MAEVARSNTTRFGVIGRRGAFTVLALFAAAIVYGLVSLDRVFPEEAAGPPAAEDTRLYRAINQRVHDGDNFYDATADELRTRGYATRPFFNFRLPTLAWTVGHLPRPAWGQWLLALLACLTAVVWVRALRLKGGAGFVAAGAVLLAGPLLLTISDVAYLYHEMWAGVLIALSLGLYARDHRIASAGVGTLALLVRELALPFAVLMLIAAMKDKNRREGAAWLGGVVVFALALAAHAYAAGQRITPADPANASWIQFGGWPFVLRTSAWNSYLILAPAWATAVALPVALLGFAGWRGATGIRVALTVGGYCCAFLVAGRMDNSYWGLLYTPLAPLGMLYAAPVVADLRRAIRGG